MMNHVIMTLYIVTNINYLNNINYQIKLKINELVQYTLEIIKT